MVDRILWHMPSGWPHEPFYLRPPRANRQLLGRGQFNPQHRAGDRDAPRYNVPTIDRNWEWSRAAHGRALRELPWRRFRQQPHSSRIYLTGWQTECRYRAMHSRPMSMRPKARSVLASITAKLSNSTKPSLSSADAIATGCCRCGTLRHRGQPRASPYIDELDRKTELDYADEHASVHALDDRG